MRDLGAFIEENFLNDDHFPARTSELPNHERKSLAADRRRTEVSTSGSLNSGVSLCNFPVPRSGKVVHKSRLVKTEANDERDLACVTSESTTSGTNGTVVGANGVPKVKYDDVFKSAKAEEPEWFSKKAPCKRPSVTASSATVTSCPSDGVSRRRALLASLPPPTKEHAPASLRVGGSLPQIANLAAHKALLKPTEVLSAKKESSPTGAATDQEIHCPETSARDNCKVDKQEPAEASLSGLFTLYESDDDDSQRDDDNGTQNQQSVAAEIKEGEGCDGTGLAASSGDAPLACNRDDIPAPQEDELEESSLPQVPHRCNPLDDICAHIGVSPELVKASGLTAGELREMQRAGVTDVSGASLQDPEWQLNAAASGLPLRKRKLHLATKVWNAQEKAVVETTEPKLMQKRKHQINWLAAEAHEKELEMLELTARTRQTKYQTAMKYGW